MNIVLFEKSEITMPLKLNDERALHIQKILHKTVGETFEAGIVNGKQGRATITLIDDRGIHFDFAPISDGIPLFPITMIVGFPRPIQLRRLFRDMASMGVAKIVLTGTQLGEKSYMQSDIVKSGKAYSLLKDGAAQAKSTFVPQLVQYDSVNKCIEGENSSGVLVALDNVRFSDNLTDFMAKIKMLNEKTHITAAIGSERGFTDEERDELEKGGFSLCSLGNRILRTETAATVAASIILSKMGALK